MDNQETGASAPRVGLSTDAPADSNSAIEEPPDSRRPRTRSATRRSSLVTAGLNGSIVLDRPPKPARRRAPRRSVPEVIEVPREVPPAFVVGPQAGGSSRDATMRRPEGPGKQSGGGLTGRRAAATRQPLVAASAAMGEGARRFRLACFPEVSDRDWSDWKWQLRNRIRDLSSLERVLELTDDERAMVAALGDRLPVGITPYYASLMDRHDPLDPIRKTMVPLGAEMIESPIELEDPLAEDADMPVPGLVHRYPDRVLFLVTSFCATYCRYCTRSRLVGKTGEYHFNHAQYQGAIDYITATKSIRDVLISGGDPLTMADDRIEWLLSRLRAIPHVEFIRIGSKVPAVLPQRITPELCAILKQYHPFWMSIHFTHPSEVTPEVAQACGRLADAGIPLGSQTVLMKGVNDDVPTMKQLMHQLLKIRVRPYYIYQMDPIPGSAHFRTPVEKGLEIIEGLRGHTTGYAVPQYVIDAPGGGGKLPLQPNYIVGRDGDWLILRNYAGETFRYPDPVEATGPVQRAGMRCS